MLHEDIHVGMKVVINSDDAPVFKKGDICEVMNESYMFNRYWRVRNAHGQGTLHPRRFDPLDSAYSPIEEGYI